MKCKLFWAPRIPIRLQTAKLSEKQHETILFFEEKKIQKGQRKQQQRLKQATRERSRVVEGGVAKGKEIWKEERQDQTQMLLPAENGSSPGSKAGPVAEPEPGLGAGSGVEHGLGRRCTRDG